MAKIIIKDGQLSSSAGINVPGSFSVSGNMVIGDSFTDTLIINSTTTFNDDLAVLDTISGSVGKFGTISGSVISASQYIGPITASPAGTSGQIQFNSNSVLSADSNFVWDNTNKRLGIGITAPQQALDVVGSMRLSTGNIYRPDNAGLALQLGNSSNSHYGTHLFFNGIGNAERIRITDGGNVGIGTTSPSAKLEIQGGSADWNETTPGTSVGTLHLDPGNITNNFGNAITFGSSDHPGNPNEGTNAQAGIYVRSDGSYGTKMYFATTDNFAAGSKTRMMINELGNVGIGTAAPVTPLNVAGEIRGNNFSDNFAGSFNVNLGNGNIEGRGLVAGYSGGSYGGIGYNVRHTATGGTYISPLADTSNYIQFSQGFQFLGDASTTAGRTTNFAELMRITNAGNVGIGTTSPTQAKLVISAPDESTSSAISIRQSNALNYGFDFALDQTSNGNGYLYGIDANTKYEVMQFTRDTTPDLYLVNGGGNVGIGTTNPGYKLDVNGITRFQSILRFVNGSWNVSDTDSRNRFYFENNGTTYFGTGNNYVWRSPADTDIANLSTGGFDLSQGSYKFNGISVISNTGNDPYGNFRVLANNSSTIQDGMYIGYNSTGGTNAHIRFYANGVTERMRIDASNGNVGIGTGAPSTRLHIANGSGLTIETVGATWANIGADVASANYMQLRRPGSANALGYIGGGGGGAISAGTSNDLAIRSEGDLHLATGNSPRVTITSAGNVGIGTSNPNFTLAITGTLGVSGNTTIANGNLIIGTGGKGIDFSAATNAAGMTNEIFDDYEVGTWTPALAVGTSTFSYDTRSGRYVKIGNLVYASFTIDTGTGTSINANSVSSITGLPFTSVSNNRSSCQIHWSGLATSVFNVFGVVEGSQTSIYLYVSTAATAGSSDMTSVYFDGSMILQGSVVYQVS